MDHPLIRNSRRVRPEQAELDVTARIKLFGGTISEKQLPIGVFFSQFFDERRTSPSPWLVHVPGHLHAYNVAKFAGRDEFLRALIICRAAPLCPDLHNFPGFLHCAANVLRVGHCVCERFFNVCVLTCADSGNSVLCVLEVRGGDHHRVNVTPFQKLSVVASAHNVFSSDFPKLCDAILASQSPNIAEPGEFKIQCRSMLLKCRQQSVTKSLGKSDHAHADPVVCSQNSRVARRSRIQRHSCSGSFQERPPRTFCQTLFVLDALPSAHFNAPALRKSALVPAILCREDSSIFPAPFQCVSRLIVPR